jgi:hypothetical protein
MLQSRFALYPCGFEALPSRVKHCCILRQMPAYLKGYVTNHVTKRRLGDERAEGRILAVALSKARAIHRQAGALVG